MSTPTPKLPTRTTGLSPKEQKLQALREKLAAQGSKGTHHASATNTAAPKSNSGFKKTSFQRKAT